MAPRSAKPRTTSAVSPGRPGGVEGRVGGEDQAERPVPRRDGRPDHRVGQHGPELVGREPERDPGVSQLDGPAQRASGATAHPDVEGTGQARGLDHEIRELEVRAVIRRLAHSPTGPDGPQGVVGPLPPPVEAVAEQLELGLERAHPHAQDDAAVAGDVERAPPLHDLEGVVIAEHDDVAQQGHALGRRRDEAERGDGVPVARPAHVGGRQRDGDVLGARHPVVAEALRRLGHGHHVVDGPRRLPLRRVETRVDVHHGGHDPQPQLHRLVPVRTRRPCRPPTAAWPRAGGWA